MQKSFSSTYSTYKWIRPQDSFAWIPKWRFCLVTESLFPIYRKNVPLKKWPQIQMGSSLCLRSCTRLCESHFQTFLWPHRDYCICYSLHYPYSSWFSYCTRNPIRLWLCILQSLPQMLAQNSQNRTKTFSSVLHRSFGLVHWKDIYHITIQKQENISESLRAGQLVFTFLLYLS